MGPQCPKMEAAKDEGRGLLSPQLMDRMTLELFKDTLNKFGLR